MRGYTTGSQGRRWRGVAVALAGLAGLAAQGGDWPSWRGPNRDGISAETGWKATWPAEGPKQVWKAEVGVGYGTVSVSQGRLYVMGNAADTDTVYGLDANTGAEVWKHSYPCVARDPNGYPGPRCTPTADEGRVFTVSRQGHFFCLDAATGKVKWSKEFKTDFSSKVPTWGFAMSPLVEGKLVIVEPGAAGASLVAFDKASGEVVWKNGDDAAAYSSPIAFTAGGERCVAILSAAGVVGRSLKDGHELWRYPWKTSYDVNAATPLIHENKVFISSGYNAGCALIDFGSNPVKELWRNKNMRNHVNSCVIWKGALYGFDESELRCLDLATGEVKWRETKYGKGAVTLADGKLILYSNRAKLGVAEPSPEGYKELALAQVIEQKESYGPNTKKDSWAVPVLANGKIYCRSISDLACLDLKAQ